MLEDPRGLRKRKSFLHGHLEVICFQTGSFLTGDGTTTEAAKRSGMASDRCKMEWAKTLLNVKMPDASFFELFPFEKGVLKTPFV